MSATLAKQFQDYAARCLELARAGRWPANTSQRRRWSTQSFRLTAVPTALRRRARVLPSPHVRKPLIRQQAQEIDALWDRLSHAYALVRRESPAEMIQEEMEALRAMLDERRRSQLKKSWLVGSAK